MQNTIKAYIHKGEEYYVAECIELPVVTQGKTIEEVLKNLKEAVSLQMEGEDLTQWNLAPNPSLLVTFEIEQPLIAQA